MLTCDINKLKRIQRGNHDEFPLMFYRERRVFNTFFFQEHKGSRFNRYLRDTLKEISCKWMSGQYNALEIMEQRRAVRYNKFQQVHVPIIILNSSDCFLHPHTPWKNCFCIRSLQNICSISYECTFSSVLKDTMVTKITLQTLKKNFIVFYALRLDDER